MEKSIEITKNERVFSLSAHFLSEFWCTQTHFPFFRERGISRQRLFLCLCGAISEVFSAIESSNAGANPVGSTFNIQNFIPHKSQKTKGFLETSRSKECQRGTAGAEERAKEGDRVPAEGSDTHLGAGCREFESPHSDQSE